MEFFWMCAIIVIYFAPYINALLRKHNNLTPIALINLVLGWTLIGWFGALVWSYTDNTNARTNIHKS